MMDDYGKSGPKTPQAEANARKRKIDNYIRSLLQARTEDEFVAGLRKEPLNVDPNHPNHKMMIKLWRERNRSH